MRSMSQFEEEVHQICDTCVTVRVDDDGVIYLAGDNTDGYFSVHELELSQKELHELAEVIEEALLTTTGPADPEDATSLSYSEGSLSLGDRQSGYRRADLEAFCQWVRLGDQTVVVTRHPGLVAHLVEIGLVAEGAEVIEHATPELVRGKRVVGVLPTYLAAEARTLTEIPMALELCDRGQELSLERVREVAGAPVTYKVEIVS